MQHYQSKSLEDIEKKKDSLIDEIDKNKICIEKEISSVVDKLDNTLEEISEQASLNVENISSFRQKLEKSYHSKLESASNSIQRSISVFEQRAKTVKAEFRNISIIILILIISLIREIIPSMNSALGEITQNNTSMGPTTSSSFIQILLYSIPYIILVLLITYFVLKAYKNISNIENYDELNKEIDNINKNRIPAREMSLSSKKVEVEKSFFDEKKAILSSLITSVGNSVPIVNNIYDEVTLLVEYKQMVKDFELCLEFYNLVGNNLAESKNLFEKLGKFAPADAHILNNENLLKKMLKLIVLIQCNCSQFYPNFGQELHNAPQYLID